MKATVNYLWNTNRQVLSFENSDVEYPGNFSDLKKCENVLVGEKIDDDTRCKERYILIDDDLYIASPVLVSHPQGGTMHLIEIM